MHNEKLAKARKAVDVARQEFDAINQKLSEAENAKNALASQTSNANKNVTQKNEALEKAKNRLLQLEAHRNTLSIFKRKERRSLDEVQIPEANQQIQALSSELVTLQSNHKNLSQSLNQAEKNVVDLKQKTERQQELMKNLGKEVTLAELEMRAENGEDNAQYQLAMLHINEGRRAKAKELAAKPGAGYAKARAEIEKIEELEKAKAQKEKDLKEIRDVTSEYIRLLNRYKDVGRWDLVGGIDDKIRDAKDTLETAEKTYMTVSANEMGQYKSILQNAVHSTKDAIGSIKEAIKHAEERQRMEDMAAKLRASSSRW